jgi:hypothetical protein
MTLGGIPQYDDCPLDIQYTPIVSEDFYSVHMDDFLVNGNSLGLPSGVYNSRYVFRFSKIKKFLGKKIPANFSWNKTRHPSFIELFLGTV